MSFLKDYILKNFGVDEKLFQEALILNPGSKGYISGAISELLLKEYLEKNRFDVFLFHARLQHWPSRPIGTIQDHSQRSFKRTLFF